MAVRITHAPAVINLQVAAFAPTQFLQRLRECSATNPCFWIVLGQVHEHAEASHALGLLCAGDEWPCCRCAAEKCDELAPSHCLPRGSGQGIVAVERCSGKDPASCPLWVISGHLQC